MKKFTTVMTFVFLFSIVAILFVVYRGNSIGRELAQTVKYDSLPAFPITKEKLPEGLVWSSGGEHKPFASSKALKGGVYHKSVTTYPTTFRQYGPNANTAFR
ncbi:MAG: hypothetical protein MK132_15665 [Lentisphaerales bacterium]|nr:hypothetical protein [Lentisphaerales bacterium]